MQDDDDDTKVEQNTDDSDYLECIRCVQGGQSRRLENLASRFDLVQYELNQPSSKSLLLYAIEHNQESIVRILLDMEVPLHRSYSVSSLSNAAFGVRLWRANLRTERLVENRSSSLSDHGSGNVGTRRSTDGANLECLRICSCSGQ